MTHSPHKKLLGRYHAAKLRFNLGSDFHILPIKTEINRFIEEITHFINTETLFLLGDVCLSSPKYGIDTSDAINEILYRLSYLFEQVLYVPGNHDLRREKPTDDPWKDFEYRSNVKMPYGENPLIITVDNTRVALANIGYDLEFIDPAIMSATKEDLLAFYSRHNDGKYLLHGKDSIPIFKKMSENARKAVMSDIDIVATHALPHPSLVRFRMPEQCDKIQQLGAALGLNFVYDPKGNMAEAALRGITLEQAIIHWNLHSIMMGSNIVNETAFSENVTFLYGHNHRSTDHIAWIDGKLVRFLSHQREFLPAESV